jgi:hypothetical protein
VSDEQSDGDIFSGCEAAETTPIQHVKRSEPTGGFAVIQEEEHSSEGIVSSQVISEDHFENKADFGYE